LVLGGGELYFVTLSISPNFSILSCSELTTSLYTLEALLAFIYASKAAQSFFSFFALGFWTTTGCSLGSDCFISIIDVIGV
jgi:hypothetical protein